ncbi:MAG: hypothetical protein HC851_24240 [Acaryochloris sp. RU_4_1]|nr:hypothetical protein [Acaryochloris sp. RU_4_1]
MLFDRPHPIPSNPKPPLPPNSHLKADRPAPQSASSAPSIARSSVGDGGGDPKPHTAGSLLQSPLPTRSLHATIEPAGYQRKAGHKLLAVRLKPLWAGIYSGATVPA